MPALAPKEGTDKMRRLFLVAALCLAGCQNVTGPFQSRTPTRVDDPLLTINEQQRRGRERLAIPEDRGALAPKLYIDRPDPLGL